MRGDCSAVTFKTSEFNIALYAVVLALHDEPRELGGCERL